MNTDIQKQVKELFIRYLEEHKQRKTPERFAILAEIYEMKEHFDVEMLHDVLKKKKYHVSRATVYNTLDVLVDSGLVIRHQFGNQVFMYEKAHGYKQHDHLICNHCHRVLEFCDPRIQQTQQMIGSILHFQVNHHSLTLHGNPITDAEKKCMSCGLQIPPTK